MPRVLMEEPRKLATFSQQQPPMTGQTFSSLSTASYFGESMFSENDPFQFAATPNTQSNDNQPLASNNSQMANFKMPQQAPPTVTTRGETVTVPTSSPVHDKQFFPNMVGPTSVLPPASLVAQNKASLQHYGQTDTPLTVSDGNFLSVNNTASSNAADFFQQLPSNVPASDETKVTGEFSLPPNSSQEQLTNVSGHPPIVHSSFSNPGSRSHSSLYHSDVASGPTSLPAYYQQVATSSGNIDTTTGPFTNADLPLSSMLQSGQLPQSNVNPLTQDGKESAHPTLLTNANISAEHNFISGMHPHSNSASNLFSLGSPTADTRTNADLFEVDQRLSEALPTGFANSLAPPTNASCNDAPKTSEQQQQQFVSPETTSLPSDQSLTMMAAVASQPAAVSSVLRTNATTGSAPVTSPCSKTDTSAVTQVDMATTATVSSQVTQSSTTAAAFPTTINSYTFPSSASTTSVSHSLQSIVGTDVHNHDLQQGTNTQSAAVAAADSKQSGDTIEQQFLLSPVTQSPTSAFVEYPMNSSDKQLHTSSGAQSVSSLLDCPDTSILASPYKIVLPSPKTIEEKQSSIPSSFARIQETDTVTASVPILEQSSAVVTTIASVQAPATPKTNMAGSSLPVTQATMTSTPKDKGGHISLPSVVSLAAPPPAQQHEQQQRHTIDGDHHGRDRTLPPSLAARQHEHDHLYHHQHYQNHPDYQSQYDFSYRYNRGTGGHYMEDDRGYYPPGPHSRIPHDYYPHDDYYYYRGRHEQYRDYGDDPYYYEGGRYHHDRDSYYGREQPRYYDREQVHYRDARHPASYGSNYYPDSRHGRDVYDDRGLGESESYRHHQYHHHTQRHYQDEHSHYSEVPERANQTSHVQQSDTSALPHEASAIYGPRDHFEASHIYNADGLQPHPSYVDSEYTGKYPEQYPDQYLEQYPEQYTDQYPEQYHEEHQQHYEDQVDGVYTSEENYYGGQEIPAHPVEPAAPVRETPLMFAHPHVVACFSGAGKLVLTVPSHNCQTVEISCVKINTDELQSFRQSVESFPGPLIVGDSTKGEVVRYASQQAELCRSNGDTNEPEHSDSDEVLLWKMLVLLCQQNGVVVSSDIADLLLHDESSTVSATALSSSDPASSIDGYRKLLLEGRRKDALEYACSRSLWGHALMLASGMEEHSRTYVVNRFTASMMTNDPLNTYYTLMLGRTPSAIKPEGLVRAGNWRAHLAMMMSNQSLLASPDHVKNSIIILGDSLLSRAQLCAAHVCYHVGGARLSHWDDSKCKFSLLGVDHTQQSLMSAPDPSVLWKTEIYEYAVGLGRHEGILVHFQTLKLLHAFRLVEAGITNKALRYCESVAKQVSRNPDLFSASLIHLLTELSIRLHHWNSPAGLVENEVSSWITQLQVIATNPRIGQTYSSRTPSNRSSQVSPTFSLTGGHQHQQQLTLGFSSNHSSSNFLHPNQALHILQQSATTIPAPAGTGSNAPDRSEDQTDNAHLTLTQEQASQYLQYMNTAHHQQQLQQFTNVLPSTTPEAAMFQYSSYSSSQAVIADNSVQQMSGGHTTIPSWTGEAITQLPSSIAQTSSHPPSFATTDVAGSDVSQFTSAELNTNIVAVQKSSDLQFGINQTSMFGGSDQGFHPGINQPVAMFPSNADQASVYGNHVSEVTSEPAFVQPDLQNLTQTAYEQPPNVVQPVISAPPTATQPVSASVTAAPAPTQLHTQPQGQEKKKLSSDKNIGQQKEDNKDSKNEKSKDGTKERSGGGWGIGNFIASILPKRKGEIHLPDDRKKKIVWDETLKKWVNQDQDDEEDSGPAAPPSDMELKGSGLAPASSGSSQPIGAIASTVPTNTGSNPPTDANVYSRARRSNAREYVNVLNPTVSNSSDNAPYPVMVPPLAANNATLFSGNFFVPKTPTSTSDHTQERKVEDFFAAQPQPGEPQGEHNAQEDSAVSNAMSQPVTEQQQWQESDAVAASANEMLWAVQQSSQQQLPQQQLPQQLLPQQPLSQQLLPQQHLLQQHIGSGVQQAAIAATGSHQQTSTTASSIAPTSTLQTSYTFGANQSNSQSDILSNTNTVSYGQPQFFNPSMFSSSVSGDGVQFTIGGGTGEQSLSRASSTSELSEEVNRHLSSSGIMQQSMPPPPSSTHHQPQPRSQVRRALGRHRLPQPRPHPQQQQDRHQGKQQWWQPTAPGRVADYKQ